MSQNKVGLCGKDDPVPLMEESPQNSTLGGLLKAVRGVHGSN